MNTCKCGAPATATWGDLPLCAQCAGTLRVDIKDTITNLLDSINDSIADTARRRFVEADAFGLQSFTDYGRKCLQDVLALELPVELRQRVDMLHTEMVTMNELANAELKRRYEG